MGEPAADGSPGILNEELVVHHRVGGMNKGSGSPVRKTSSASQPYPDREQSQYEAASEASFGNWDNNPWNAGKGNGKMEPRLHQLLTRLRNAQPNPADHALSDPNDDNHEIQTVEVEEGSPLRLASPETTVGQQMSETSLESFPLSSISDTTEEERYLKTLLGLEISHRPSPLRSASAEWRVLETSPRRKQAPRKSNSEEDEREDRPEKRQKRSYDAAEGKDKGPERPHHLHAPSGSNSYIQPLSGDQAPEDSKRVLTRTVIDLTNLEDPLVRSSPGQDTGPSVALTRPPTETSTRPPPPAIQPSQSPAQSPVEQSIHTSQSLPTNRIQNTAPKASQDRSRRAPVQRTFGPEIQNSFSRPTTVETGVLPHIFTTTPRPPGMAGPPRPRGRPPW